MRNGKKKNEEYSHLIKCSLYEKIVITQTLKRWAILNQEPMSRPTGGSWADNIIILKVQHTYT